MDNRPDPPKTPTTRAARRNRRRARIRAVVRSERLPPDAATRVPSPEPSYKIINVEDVLRAHKHTSTSV